MELSSHNGGPLVFKCTCSHVCAGGTQLPQLRQRPSPRNIKAGRHVNPTHLTLSSESSADPLGKASCLTDPNEYFPHPPMSCLDSGCLVVRDFGTDHDALGSPRPLRSDLANVSYELSEDLRAKEIELIERCYGGRLRAQRAARVIQNCYRDYRLRTEYARLRLEKCSNRKLDPIPQMSPTVKSSCATVCGTTIPTILSPPSTGLAQKNESHPSSSPYRRPALHSSGSLEDLVLEQAYVDWALKAATAQAGYSMPDATGLTISERAPDDNYSATPSFSSSSSVEVIALRPEKMNIPTADVSSPGVASNGDDTVFSDSHIPSSDMNFGFSRVTCHTSNAPPVAPCNCCMTRITPSALSCELQRRRPSPVRKLSSPASPQTVLVPGVGPSDNHASAAHTQHSDPNLIQMGIVGSGVYCTTSSAPTGTACTCSSFTELVPTAIASKQSFAVAHSQNTIPVQHVRCCHCSHSLPKSGVIACCYTQPPRIMVANSQTPASVSGGRHVLVTATTTNGGGGVIIDQNKLPRQSLSNSQIRIPSGQMLVAVSASTGQLTRTHPAYVHQSVSHASHPSHSQHNHDHHRHHHHPHHLPAQTLGHTRNASLPHNQLIQLNANGKSPPTCLVIPAQCHLHGGHGTVTSLTDGGPVHGHAVAQAHDSPSTSPSVAQLQQMAIAKNQVRQQEKRRKRVYRIGLNIFNKSPLKGVEFLIKYGFLDCAPETIARFLLTRKGLSRVAIGDYLGNTKDELAMTTTRQFMRELDFREQEVDEALRSLLSCFRTPGESQKIVHLLTEFQAAYVEQNSARVKAQFRNVDSVMVLAYAIVMLHTDMYSPNVRPQSKMTRDEFVRNLRGVDAGEDLDRNLLLAIYDRIQQREMSVAADHTDQVRKIQQHLTGPLRPLNLAIPQRRLVCYCRLYEVPDKNKRERPGSHQREVFLFNDLLLITKAVQKKRRDAAVAYQVRISLSLLGIRLTAFETAYHPHGLELLLPVGESNISLNSKESGLNPAAPFTTDGRARILVTLNTKTLSDRARFMEDLQECIVEVAEMDRIRIEEEVVKQMQQKRRLSKQLSSATVGSHLSNNYICNNAYSYCKSNGNHTTDNNNGNCAFMSSQGRLKAVRVLGDDRTKRPSDWAHARLTTSALTSGKAVRAKTVPREFEAMVRRGTTSGIVSIMASGEELHETCVSRPGVLDTRGSSTKPCTDVVDENQRLSGDSGLLADLETPTSLSSHTLGSSSSYSPT
ncbi:IQ motif and SEC7 domain-containing protein 1 [Fasciola hepatica]|uniref:IQ motif and SEC7 domain-containing protein 1 n=1 Tax=Fasciola hepatica TaxID=6192 RepID=A0A4E0RD19_FASHE|nr:IQ motif and SEC7 domain-containing protein 1 [Fasciola hepatica]